MRVDLRGVTTVVLAGTGSDDDYIRRAFGGPLRAAGAVLVAPRPQPQRLVAGYLDALDEASRDRPIAVGGVSIGAVVAAEWALAHSGRAVAVLAALPPWTGDPGSAPAAVAARHTAAALRRDGLAATTAAMRASSPSWLADELARSWHAQWPGLPDAMEQAASHVGPSRAELERLETPMGVAGAADDLIHPVQVAQEWAAAAAHSCVRILTLDEFGPDPAALGAACLAALVQADG